MSKQAIARVVTVVVLVVALGVVFARKDDLRPSLTGLTRRTEQSPQDAIYAMLDAARNGDVKKYVASYSGQIAQSLERARNESHDFAAYLRDSNAALKGVAVMDPQPQSEREVKVRVEYVYQDRNEAQLYYLEKARDGWKIAKVETAERVKTVIPYGTPVQ
jgi:hypothetical protein